MAIEKQREGLASTLKSWALNEPEIPETSDDLLKIFAHVANGDEDNAKRMITSYYTLRSSTPELFNNRDIDNDQLRNVLSLYNIFISPKPTPEGYRVLLCLMIDPDTKRYDMMAQMKYFIMTLEANLMCDNICPGYILVFESSTLTTRHVLKFSPSGLRKISAYLLEAIPLTIEEVFLINSSAIADFMMKVARPFISSEILKKTSFLKASDLDKLYQKVPRECLPKEFGGSLPESCSFSEENTKKLRRLKNTFAKEEAVLKTLALRQ